MMTIQLGKHIVAGCLDNSRVNSVHGWLSFGGDCGIRIDLLGDLAGDMRGRKIEFEVPGKSPSESEIAGVPELNTMQIGAAGEMRLSPDTGSDLYLEWFSQNGRIQAEIPNVTWKEVEVEKEELEDSLPSVEQETEDDGEPAGDEITDVVPWEDDLEPDDDEDPYGLFPADLESQLHAPDPLTDEMDEQPKPRDWSEVIPGIDPETKAMYEQWDEIYGQQKDEYLADLIDPPLQLPPVDAVTDEAAARRLVLRIAASLARLGVAIGLCRHFTMVRTYRWLLEEILVEGHVHPGLAATDIVMHYSTYESCKACDAEFEARWQREHGGE